jgi:hypothetical protein
MAGVPRWKVCEKQQVKWLVASVCSPPLRQAATTLAAIWGQCLAKIKKEYLNINNIKLNAHEKISNNSHFYYSNLRFLAN